MNFKLELSSVLQTEFYHLLPVRCGWSWEKAQSCTAGAEDGSEQSRHRESRHRRDSKGFRVKTATPVGRVPGLSAVHCTHQRPLSVPVLVEKPQRPLTGRAGSSCLLFLVREPLPRWTDCMCRHPQLSHFKVYSDHKPRNILINFIRHQVEQSAARVWR